MIIATGKNNLINKAGSSIDEKKISGFQITILSLLTVGCIWIPHTLALAHLLTFY